MLSPVTVGSAIAKSSPLASSSTFAHLAGPNFLESLEDGRSVTRELRLESKASDIGGSMTALDARSAAIAAIVAMVVFCSLNVAHCKSFYTNRDLPKNGEWIPMGNDGSGFMQAADSELIQYMRNHHGRTLQQENKKHRSMSEGSFSSGYYSSSSYSFVDGSETFWPEGAQAWHLLGAYVDCYDEEGKYDNERRHRNLGNNRAYGEEEQQYGPCVRYLLWAAVRNSPYS